MKRTYLLSLLAVICIVGVSSAEPLTLRAAGLEALERHPDIDVAHYTVDIERARLKQRQAPFYPTVLASAGYTRAQDTTDNNLSASVSGVQTLADFGKRRNRSRQQERQLQASLERQEGTVQRLLSQVATAYLSLNRDQQLVTIQDSNIRWSRLRLKEAKSRGLDRTLAESDLSAARLGKLNAVNARKISQVQLGNAMGRGTICTDKVAAAFFDMPDWDGDQAQEIAMEQRPELRAARAETRAAQSGLKANQAEYRPNLSAVADYGYLNLGLPQELDQWRVGVQLSFPIWNEPLLSGAIEQAEAEVNRREALARSLELSISGQVNASLVNVRQTRLQVYQNQRNVLGAYQTFIETWAHYRAGRGTSRDVSNAQRDVITSQTALVSNAFAHQQALVQLYLDTGQLSLEVLPDDKTSLSNSINRNLSPLRRELPTRSE